MISTENACTPLASLANNVATLLLGEDVALRRGPFCDVASSEELRDEDRLGSGRVVVVRHIFEDEADVLIQ